MATNKTSTVTEARRRAREAKAALDAERARHDKQVEEATTNYYVAVGRIEELQTEIGEQQDAADATVRQLLDMGETADRVAQLTSLTTREVRRVRRAGGGESAASEDQGAASTE